MSCVFSNPIRSRDEIEVKYLLDYGVDPNQLLSNGQYTRRILKPYRSTILKSYGETMSPFGEAIGVSQTGSLSLVELFLKAGCDPKGIVAKLSSKPMRKLSTIITQTITAFLAVIGTRNIQMVELFIRNGAIINPTMTDCIRRTPLQRAAEIGCFEMVELLHNFGADINTLPVVMGGATALQLAAIGGYNRIVCYLLSHKAKVDAPAAMINGMTALEGAAFNGWTDTVHILLKAGAASRGEDRSQLEKAMKMAREQGHFPTADLIQDWPNLQDDGDLRMLDDMEDDIRENEIDEFVNWDGECCA
ncbi:ankyrin repeat-containing domain protein [Daldinia loculata]|uniref:ankyrin repeat-containing domain protein n=1 Tax=Daldinia loculata TaxID=103429 RepID=UPI0020C1E508|nr:ankyrin repeat-containing domain protein [Daldinia loculata]KAI1649307.1 ankyrin repeat-containing domain protein [Daldinia loculata]